MKTQQTTVEGRAPRVPIQPNTPTLRNEFGFWELIWNGQHAVLRCEPGAAYVAWLLENRPLEPISALELAAKVTGVTCPCFGSAEVFHPDQAAATFFWLRKQHELEVLVDCEDTLDPVKEEALCELEAIYAYQRRHPNHPSCDPEHVARSVVKAIENFCRHMTEAFDLRGEPHELVRQFGKYVRDHLRLGDEGKWECN